ncbi:MAG: aminopeptidase P family N-terminal domain-containing protein, partial [Odoribacter sp.]|nr:aminopeptidase P family N-terminal domain-containing protein [Odoribacter sp.]
QLDGTGIRLHKLRVPDAVDYPDWLAAVLPENGRVGLDYFCTSVSGMKELQAKLAPKGIQLVDKNEFIGDLWIDRPALPEGKLFTVPAEVAGKSAQEKIRMVQDALREKNADYFLFSALDEIAWLFNIRCNDIEYNPVAIAYAVGGRERSWLFVKRPKVSQEVAETLGCANVEIRDYHHLFLFLDETGKDARFCVDANSLNFAVYHKITSLAAVTETVSPVIFAKSVKTPEEIQGFREACVKDSVAITKFFYWLESNIGNKLTETAVSEKLTALRALDKAYVSDSFENISAYGNNAALPHYSAVPGADSILEPKGLYLVDSGGQYTHGTTDITRTVSLGELTSLEKEDYTIVLKGMIALRRSLFPKGTRGCNIDAIARQPMWQTCRNFGHGTGHGIGFFLNVHEGPQTIRQDLKDQPICPGMVTSDEPGIYRAGVHGIR